MVLRFVTACLVHAAGAWELRGPEDQPTGTTIEPSAWFVAAPAPAGTVVTDPVALAAVAEQTLRYLRAAHGVDPAADGGLFTALGVTDARMERTLELVIDTARAHPERLTDPDWLARTFEMWTWTPDPAEPKVKRWSLAPRSIRVTRYLTVQVEGRAAREEAYDQALWADPGAAARGRYTRRQVMEGAWQTGPDAGGAQALVWLPEGAVHDALMQGSVEVRFPDGHTTVYGVDVPNGIAYVPSKRGRDQDRFWYFRPLPGGPRGWGQPGLPDVQLQAGVTVAGDVYNLGLGRLVLLDHPDGAGGTTLRLAVLADSGGAFQPNLCQLDWYGGAFPSHAALYAAWKALPEHVGARILVVRE